jgi:L-2,4-diaminobutyrate transaminase
MFIRLAHVCTLCEHCVMTFSLSDVDRLNVFHPFTALARHEQVGPRMTIVAGSGVRLTDDQGRTYIDAMAGLWCVNVGYGRPELADAMYQQAKRLPYYHSFGSMATEAPALLAERLLAMSPVPMSKVFFGNSGSDANDTHVKMIWAYNNALGRPAKKKIIARQRGYHGTTVVSASLTGLANMHAGFDLPLPQILHTTAPHRVWEPDAGTDAEFSARLARDLEELILGEGPDTVAAFIAEPVQAAGGVIVPPEGYFEAIQAVLHKYDVLLIADEVVTGFGRLGTMFGTEVFGLRPDLITVAKGITSGYAPLSACLVSEKIWRVLVDSTRNRVWSHGYTYSSHPISAAVALANLNLIEDEGLVGQTAPLGEYLRAQLRSVFAEHPLVVDIRGTGLLAAVEFGQRDPLAPFDPTLGVGPRMAAACLDEGIISRALPEADTLSFSPPFVVTESELDEVVAGVSRAVDTVTNDLVALPD